MQLTYKNINLTLSKPFVSYKGVTNYLNHILVKITWNELTGYGIAIPGKESQLDSSAIFTTLKKYVPFVNNATPFQLQQLLQTLEKIAPEQSAALSAIDMALHDLLGKITGLPLCHLFGFENLSLPNTALSLGLMSIDEATYHANINASWPILKLKMSTPDENLLRSIRKVYGGRLWIDANGAWTFKQAIEAVKKFYDYNVELIEQPVPPHCYDALRYIHERAPMLIFADEDCHNPADLFKLQHCVSGINIKLLKCGGIRKAMEMIQIARQLKFKVMLGCKTESVLGITAMAHLGGLADYLDLDGHLDIVDDPFRGLTINHGRLTLPSTIGLGVTQGVNMLTINKYHQNVF